MEPFRSLWYELQNFTISKPSVELDGKSIKFKKVKNNPNQ